MDGLIVRRRDSHGTGSAGLVRLRHRGPARLCGPVPISPAVGPEGE